MHISYCLILLTAMCGFGKLVFSQDSENSDGSIARKSVTKRQAGKKSYPGCGLRSPQIPGGGRPGPPQNQERGRPGPPQNQERGRNGPPQNQERGRPDPNNWFPQNLRFRGKRSNSLGLSFFTREKRDILPNVVGGSTSVENSWPWMVALIMNAPPYTACGASLISDRFLLTAAHCFNSENGNINPSKYNVVVGSNIIRTGTKYPLRRVIVHPKYQAGPLFNDIALLEAGNPIRLSRKVYPVCLPTNGDNVEREKQKLTVTGWGNTQYQGQSSTRLQELTMQIVPMRECNSSYARSGRPLWPGVFCAGFMQGGKGSCHGDSGGPIVSKMGDNSYTQMGVVSFGVRCAEPGFPGVYTRISHYMDWIYENTDLKKV